MASKPNPSAAAGASASNSQSPASTASVGSNSAPVDNTGNAPVAGETPTATEARKRAAAANFLPIVRGRLPLIFVHAVRFNDAVKAMGNKDLASKLGTSIGKVFDIRKNRNFAYVTAGFKPTAEDVAAAKSWIEQVGTQNAKGVGALGDKVLMAQLLEDAQKGGLATAAEAAAFANERVASRPSKAPGANGVAAGNALPGAAANKPQTGGASAESLLA
jgi:hypothetical protein